MKLNGTVAMVTGGARRIGRAIVLELARGGCDVAIHYRHSKAEAEQLAIQVGELGRRAVTVGGDLNDPETWPHIVRETVDSLHRLDVLVNNASAFLTEEPDTIEMFDRQRWESMLRTNVVAPVALCHYAQEHLKAHGCGRIINLCDISASRPWPDRLAYCTSKAALAAATKGLARAFAPDILVNAIAPGIAVFSDEYAAEERRKLTGRVPLGRAGTPEEVARLVRFLVESGDYMTGQVIPLDGGRSII